MVGAAASPGCFRGRAHTGASLPVQPQTLGPWAWSRCRAAGAQTWMARGGREGLPSPHVPTPPPALAQHPSRETGVSCARAPEAPVSERGSEGKRASASVHERPRMSARQHPFGTCCQRPHPVCLKRHHWRFLLWVRCCLRQIFSECLLCTRHWEPGGKYVDVPLRESCTMRPRTVNRQ